MKQLIHYCKAHTTVGGQRLSRKPGFFCRTESDGDMSNPRSRRELHRKRPRVDGDLLLLIDGHRGPDAEERVCITDMMMHTEKTLRTTMEQTKLVMVMYDFLPTETWAMFFGEDKVTDINGEPPNPYFSSIHFLVETMCYKLSLVADPERRVCQDYLRSCYLLTLFVRSTRRIIYIRRLAGKQWRQLWWPLDVRPLMLA